MTMIFMKYKQLPKNLKIVIWSSIYFYISNLLIIFLNTIFEIKYNNTYNTFTELEIPFLILFPFLTYFLLDGNSKIWKLWLLVQLPPLSEMIYLTSLFYLSTYSTLLDIITWSLFSILYLNIFVQTLFSKEAKEIRKGNNLTKSETSN